MQETEEPKFPEILPVIEKYLKKQQANGEPMRIHFWDNHNIPEPAQILADKSLHDLVKKYGAPLYAVETLDVTYTKSLIPESLTDEERKENFNKIKAENEKAQNPRLDSTLKIIEYSYNDLGSKNPTRIVLPDTREAEIKERLTKDEYTLFQNAKQLEREIIKQFKNFDTPQEFQRFGQQEFHKKFSAQEMEQFGNINIKIIPIIVGDINTGNTARMDKEISDNINAVFDPKKDVQLTIYGIGHFTKQNDLNERMEGLSIAIINSNHESFKKIRELYLESPLKEIHNQFPDYVYYANEKRIVKMDNDADKAEFLGLNAEQFKAWELGRKIDEPVKLPYSPMDKQVSLRAPQVHSFPAKTGNNNKQPIISI